jgi:hypothetical protein
MFALFAGLASGLVHVLSGPDHLAAVAPLTVGDDRPHWRAGFQWGVGHTVGVLVIGALLLGFRELLPLEAISAYSERIVGVSLIAVGIWGGYRATRLRVHRHPGGAVHAHVKQHHGRTMASEDHAAQHQHPHLHGHVQTQASFFMGALHGVAGSSHLFGVLPALALSTRLDAAAYLGGFGIGAIAAMSAFAALVGLIAQRAGRRNLGAHRGFLYACSISAVLVGGFWLIG